MLPLACPTSRLGRLTWLMGTLCLLTAMTAAQAPSPPTSVYGMAYATIDENTFYIQGGVILPPPGGTVTQVTSQFYSLDLTQNWDAASPPWKQLTTPSNLPQTERHSMTVSPNRQTLSIWLTSPASIGNYSIKTGTWTPVPLSPNVSISGNSLHAVADPTTGLVYIPAAGLGSSNNMVRFSFVTGQTTLSDIPLRIVSATYAYAIAWCQPRNTFILFTGNTSTIVPFFEYNLASGQWFRMPSLGKSTPAFRQRSCLVPAYNGTKMVLFGGDNGSGPSVASISVLDIATMVWTDGEDAPDPRSEMACTVAGDNFIVWGGYKELVTTDTIGVPTIPLIYNLKSGKWTDKFVRIPPAGNNTSGGSGGGSGDGTGTGRDGGQTVGGGETVVRGDSTNKAAAIGGGVAGAVVVIATIAFFVVRKRRQHKDEKGFDMAPSKPVMSSMENSSDGHASSGDYHQNRWAQKEHQQNQKQILKQQQQHQSITTNNPQHSSENDLQGGVSGSPQAYPVPPRSQPGIASNQYMNSAPGAPQNYNQQLQKGHGQYAPYGNSSSNPQYDPSEHYNNINHPQYNPNEVRTYSSPSSVRAPQGAADPTSAVNNEELLEQINSMQAEWNRRQAQMNP